MSTDLPDEIKRWTAKRRTALVLELLRGETTVHGAARKHGLKPSEIQHWQETFLAAGENGLKSRPKEELERKDAEIQKLKQNGMIERFFRSLEEECVWLYNFKSFKEAKETITTWIEFYNNQRLHQAFGYQSPAERRAQFQQQVA
ncbi:MAG: integrase core domain-containing protein [Myxococcota bacterium]|nr:integrase core domain-containing protein [Myxococcota bacterium]